MLNQFKFVTGNPNKVREASEILDLILEPVQVGGLFEVQSPDLDVVVRHKALQAYASLQCPVMVEDSGLLFRAWNGLPGALVKWFEETVGCSGMLKMVEGFSDRGATAICCFAVYDGQTMKIARGEVNGTLSDSIRGKNGFGWDVIFIPEGHEQTYGEMSASEKNGISHRKRALDELKQIL
ncbi:MAG: RdgB/HAM1 family non-canonical purine NTP pyrophosphatase [Nitrospinae bacterium]|nr:RdgB/HAM1 family non-canonical purine NTP pyrophosphatase [Nitrospinota bacterium]MBL7019097.1 RdgB/HAM1 family non-canonical purine NTP pyrophosphatase [Nitrospinaceae bacterium]